MTRRSHSSGNRPSLPKALLNMTISQAEELKREWTDKHVVVHSGVPELRRFEGLTGRVKTVNMSGRALVEFDGPVDIGWYDIHPGWLSIVEAPLPKTKAERHEPADKPETKSRAAEKPAVKPATGVSPLDLIRQQGASGASKPDAAPASAKISPLEAIRRQQAAKAGGESATATPEPAATEPAPEKPATPAVKGDTAGLSPLEIIRRQGAAKR